MNDGGHRYVKYAVAALLLGLYAAVSAWIVAGEGESYRKSIARKPDTASTTTIDSGSIEAAVKEATKPTVTTTERAPEPKPIPPTPATKNSPPPTPTEKPQPPNPDHPSDPSAHPSTSPTATAKAAPNIDPFWNEPDQKKIWDFDKITAADERELGLALNKMILHHYPEIEEGPLPKRVISAAKPYLSAVTRKDVKYTFTVLDSPLLNVFSHPGGYIYVTKGLFDWIAEDEDYALGFILAHEIAHVDMAHAITCLRDPEIKKFKFGTGLLFNAVIIPGGYLDSQEFEADRWALTRMLSAGRSRYEALAFLRRLEDYAKTNGFENKRKNPNDKPQVPILDNHIRAHPIPRDRLDAAKAVIDRLQKI